MADGKKSFTYHQTHSQHLHQKICRGIIPITPRMRLQGEQLLESVYSKLRLKDLNTRMLQREHRSQALFNPVVQVPRRPLPPLLLYQLYLKSKIQRRDKPIPLGLQRPVKHTAILGPVLLVWTRQNMPPLSTLPRAPRMRHRPIIDTRPLRRPKETLDIHLLAWRIYDR